MLNQSILVITKKDNNDWINYLFRPVTVGSARQECPPASSRFSEATTGNTSGLASEIPRRDKAWKRNGSFKVQISMEMRNGFSPGWLALKMGFHWHFQLWSSRDNLTPTRSAGGPQHLLCVACNFWRVKWFRFVSRSVLPLRCIINTYLFGSVRRIGYTSILSCPFSLDIDLNKCLDLSNLLAEMFLQSFKCRSFNCAVRSNKKDNRSLWCFVIGMKQYH